MYLSCVVNKQNFNLQKAKYFKCYVKFQNKIFDYNSYRPSKCLFRLRPFGIVVTYYSNCLIFFYVYYFQSNIKYVYKTKNKSQ